MLILMLLVSGLLMSGLTGLPVAHAAAAGSITAWGENTDGQLDIPAGLRNATAIVAGASHNLALRSDGTVVAWGDNAAGQTNVPMGMANVTAVTAGDFHNLALRNDGTVVGWGNNVNGSLNIPPGLSNIVAIDAGSSHSLALKSDGKVIAWGGNGNGQLNLPSGLDNVITIAAGSSHSLALKSDGTVMTWGGNGPQLAVPPGLSNVVAVAAGNNYSLALKGDGTVVAWGDSANDHLNVPAGLSNVIAITAAYDHSLALLGDGTVVTWGYNGNGQLAIPSGLNNVVAVAVGKLHSLALLGDGSLVTGWGYGEDGELDIPAGLATVKAVSAGSFNSLALKSDGTVVAWGALGDTDAGQNNIPAGLSNVIAISAPGYSHNYALKSNGTVVGWGDNYFGQLNIPSGLGNVKAVSAGNYQGLALKSDGTVVGWGDGSAGELNIPSGLNNVRAISMGGAHSVALKGDGTVVTWGDSSGGQLNVPAGLNNVIAVKAGGLHTLALKGDGTVVGWGNNRSGQLNIPAGLNNVIAVEAGGEFSVALKGDGTVVAWGTNFYGETNVPPGLNNVTAISGGAAFSLALYAADVTAPTSTATTSPGSPNGNNGWWTSNVAVSVSATDNPGGSGVRSITYSASGAQTIAPTTINAASAGLIINGNGTTTVTYYATDNNGNVEASRTLTIKLDKSAPAVTATPDRAANAAGWYNAPVTYSFSGVDPANGSGGVACETPETYSGPDSASAAVMGSCTDAAGNAGSATASLKYDTTRPTISASARKADGSAYAAGTWTNQSVTVSFSCTDASSGIAAGACPAPVTVSAEGATPAVSGSVSDQAGNSNSASFGPIWIDKSAPTVTATPDRAADSNGWYNAPVSFSFSGVDPTGGAGGVSCEAARTYSGPDSASAAVTGSCTDAAGNVGSTTASLKYDTTRPTIAASARKADGTTYTAGSWTNQSVTVSFSCADVTSGIPLGTCPAPVTVSAEGATPAVSASVSDQAGNSSSASFGPILIDTTAPTVTATPDRTPDSSGWYNAAVSFSFSGVDTAGGSAGITCEAAKTYSGPDSGSASVTGSCTDTAGNSSSVTPTFQYDATRPTITIATPTAGSYLLNQVVTVSFSCTDGLSGVAGCVGSVANNGSLSTSSVGSKSFTVTATDAAGNSYSQSVSYTVGYNWEGFFQPVDNLPTINTANAGRAIPLKWRVLDAAGNPVTNLTSVHVTSVAGGCSAGAPSDGVEEYATSTSGLLNHGNGSYQFNWQTEKSWAGSCRTLRVDIGDGVLHTAMFQFR